MDQHKNLADRKKDIFEEDIIALVDDEAMRGKNDVLQFVSLQVKAGSKRPQIAILEMAVDGKVKKSKATGNGPVDAVFRAIRNIYPHPDVWLKLYQVHAVTGGTDAQVEVTVKLDEEGMIVTGQSADDDTLVASCKSYIHALNKLIARRGREPHEAGP